MSAARASAPGKVVLCGEYAVLHGYPAIAAAVNRRARVCVEPYDGDCLELVTRGYRDGRRRLRPRADGGFDYLDDAPGESDFALFESAWKNLRPDQAGGCTVTLDTAEFVSADGRKLGLGSSAALAVALCGALGDGQPETTSSRAMLMHRAVQGGGSGVDVACAMYGGIIEYRVDVEADAASTSSQRKPRNFTLRRLTRTTDIRTELPFGLHCAIFWSGRPADTPSRIARLAADLQQGAGRASLDALGEQAERVAARWRDDDAAALLTELATYAERLSDFDRTHDLGVFAGGHRALNDVAAAAGLVYKPCGAGGGDVGAAFAPDAAALDEFADHAADRGALRLDLELGAAGLRTTGY